MVPFPRLLSTRYAEEIESTKKILCSAACLYAYSFALVVLFPLFTGAFTQRMGGDNILTSLSAKLVLTPFLWTDARLGFITSYILHPFAFLNMYTLFTAEFLVKQAFLAFVPVA